jgi:hypothetical protein
MFLYVLNQENSTVGKEEAMKKVALIVTVLFVLGPCAYGGEVKRIEMKLGHFAADSHPGNAASKMFAETIIYPNNALGAPPHGPYRSEYPRWSTAIGSFVAQADDFEDAGDKI